VTKAVIDVLILTKALFTLLNNVFRLHTAVLLQMTIWFVFDITLALLMVHSDAITIKLYLFRNAEFLQCSHHQVF
jgi:hypothetical protein